MAKIGDVIPLLTVAKDLAAAAAAWRDARRAVNDAKAEVTRTQQRLVEARAELSDAIVAAARGGARMRDMVAETGLSREWIRTVLRQHGILAGDE